MYKICITIGNWSNDGHEKMERFYIESNLSPPQITLAYERAVEITGVDLMEEICNTGLDNKFPPDVLDIWREYGIINAGAEYSGGYPPEDFADTWLAYIQLGNSRFAWGPLHIDGYFNIGGGYGLYDQGARSNNDHS